MARIELDGLGDTEGMLWTLGLPWERAGMRLRESCSLTRGWDLRHGVGLKLETSCSASDCGREGETELENPDVWLGRKWENRVQ